MKCYNLTLLVGILFIVASCKNEEQQIKIIPTESSAHRPFEDIDVPSLRYEVVAEKGDTLVDHKGNIVILPSNCFLDHNGAEVSGAVEIQFRTFDDPIDYFLSGIPMNYDTAGKKYTFESAAMCELKAMQAGKPLFVNQKHKPEILLTSQTKSPDHNLYFLDPQTKAWIPKGKGLIETVSNNSTGKKEVKLKEALTTNVPDANSPEFGAVLPQLEKPGLPIIEVEVDPRSFKELLQYHNLKFQIAETNKGFDPKDAEIEWLAVNLVKGSKEGQYKIRFRNATKTVVYDVIPVLSEKDYQAAISKNLPKTQPSKSKPIDNVATKQAELLGRIDKIIARKNSEILAIKKANEQANEAYQRIQRDTMGQIFRSFQIDGFGTWNFDRPNPYQIVIANGQFWDNVQTNLQLTTTTTFTPKIKSIYSNNGNNLTVINKAANYILGVSNNHLFYSKIFANFDKKTQGAMDTTDIVFTQLPDKQKNYLSIKSLFQN